MDAFQITSRKKVLFVCAQNRMRSFTAEKMFCGSMLYDVKSRGVAKDARIKLTEPDIRWADVIFVMEKNHKNRIAKDFRSAIVGKKIVCLFIEDIYDPMEPALIRELRQKLAPYLLLPEEKDPNQITTDNSGASPLRV
jgi:predicted protein tyrosine phosphatase